MKKGIKKMNKIVNYEEIKAGQIFRDCNENSQTYGQVFIKKYSCFDSVVCLTGRGAGQECEFEPDERVLPFTPFNLA